MSARMSRAELRQTLEHCSGRRIVVFGDLMLDEYLWGAAKRISPEAPVMVVTVDQETYRPGGAANVANNLIALGANVAIGGVIGDDPSGKLLRRSLSQEGADVTAVTVDRSRPTTRKTRVVAHSQQVVRFDREDARPLAPATAEALMAQMDRIIDQADAVIVSDYAKGVITPATGPRLLQAATQAAIPVLANVKPRSLSSISGATLITLNQFEAHDASGSGSFHDGRGIIAAGHDLRRKLNCATLVVTRGSAGLCVWGDEDEYKMVPARPVEVYDVAGAGDTVISVLGLALACGIGVAAAAEMATCAAACVVRKVGVATATPEEMLSIW